MAIGGAMYEMEGPFRKEIATFMVNRYLM